MTCLKPGEIAEAKMIVGQLQKSGIVDEVWVYGKKVCYFVGDNVDARYKSAVDELQPAIL